MSEVTIPSLRQIARYGWKPSLPDALDHIADHSGIKVLAEVDPRGEYMTAIYNQGDEGSCTSNTVCEALDADLIVSGKSPIYPSRHGIYLGERSLEGSPLNQDTGAFGRDGFKWAQKFGYYTEKAWPYLANPNQAPTDCKAFYTDESKSLGKAPYKLGSPYKVVTRSIQAFKSVLSNKQTIAIGFTVYESFESNAVATTGIMPYPDVNKESVLGGHEVLVVGYLKSEPNYALVRNHWDVDWGIKGYFLMPWTVILDGNMSSDFRTIYRAA